MATQNEKERLLNILHAHGQQFLSTFDIPSVPGSSGRDSDASEFEEEWTSFNLSSNRRISETASDGEHDDDPDTFTASSSHTPDVTVFQESAQKQPVVSSLAKGLRKSFMSSKVSNITSSVQSASKKKIPDEESDDERTNIQNDALLHRLVHTKLLSGSLNPELDLNHAQKGRALAGRVLELAGGAKLGKGEIVFRQEQRNKAEKRVREGLIRKQRMQEKKALEEAKDLGNYHPTLKRLYDSNTSSAPRKKRARGLGMGVGKFVEGTLKLGRGDIATVTGSEKRSQDNCHRGRRQRSSK